MMNNISQRVYVAVVKRNSPRQHINTYYSIVLSINISNYVYI